MRLCVAVFLFLKLIRLWGVFTGRGAELEREIPATEDRIHERRVVRVNDLAIQRYPAQAQWNAKRARHG